MSDFARRLIRWQSKHGRHGLPWQGTRDPCRIWLSEIMLQQTQVATVIPYYERFLARFPDVAALARASIDDVLTLWSGLGYYSRARNLHAAAMAVMTRHGGRFPRTRAELESLPGVGRSTAAAIAVFAFGAREAILDGNVKRVLARHFAVRGYPGDKRVENRLWELAESLLPRKAVESYIQALMDLGATVCARARPDCERCPVRTSCLARARGQIAAYPQPRLRRTVPVKGTAMLLLLRQGEVLLEKRPPAGIWGGLWCLPEMPAGENPHRYCARRFGARLSSARQLPVLQHGFTHFKLNITPMVCRVAGSSQGAAEPGLIWLPPDEAAGAAVPAPVRKLLAALLCLPPL
ncbi:MAG: A/G-specific adenine glycosylase [Burkholderiales bacterium]